MPTDRAHSLAGAAPSDDRSTVARLAEGAVRCVASCRCGQDPGFVTVLRGFDSASRKQAIAVRDRLRRRGVTARVSASPVAATRDQLHGVPLSSSKAPHVCAFVDATLGGRLDTDRIAGWMGSPLVSLAGADGKEQLEVRPLVRLRFDGSGADREQALPSTAGEVVAVAFEGIEVLPKQPESGTLRLRVDDGVPADLPEGRGIEIRLRDGQLQVAATPAEPERRTWTAATVVVECTSGSYSVSRDGLLVADLDVPLTLIADPTGFVRHPV